MAEKLTEAQRRALLNAPGNWLKLRWSRIGGRRPDLTLGALERRQLVEVRSVLPLTLMGDFEWRITDAGRAALKEG